MAGDMRKHLRTSGAKSSRAIKARAAGRRIEEFMKKSQASGNQERRSRLRVEALVKRLGL